MVLNPFQQVGMGSFFEFRVNRSINCVFD